MAEEKTEAILKPIMTARCPKCGTEIKFYAPDKPGIVKLKCVKSECQSPFGVKITEKQIQLGTGNSPKPEDKAADHPVTHPKTSPIFQNSGGIPSTNMAHIVQKKKHFFKKDKIHRLNIGTNTIGMYDPADPSDIMIEDDRTISHRSITITVENAGKYYKYLLTVNKATNPVFLSGKEIPVGTSIYFEPGSTFMLGSTQFLLTDN